MANNIRGITVEIDGSTTKLTTALQGVNKEIRDLDLLTIGMVNDMFCESRNDDYKGYKEIATQAYFDLF